MLDSTQKKPFGHGIGVSVVVELQKAPAGQGFRTLFSQKFEIPHSRQILTISEKSDDSKVVESNSGSMKNPFEQKSQTVDAEFGICKLGQLLQVMLPSASAIVKPLHFNGVAVFSGQINPSGQIAGIVLLSFPQ